MVLDAKSAQQRYGDFPSGKKGNGVRWGWSDGTTHTMPHYETINIRTNFLCVVRGYIPDHPDDDKLLDDLHTAICYAEWCCGGPNDANRHIWLCDNFTFHLKHDNNEDHGIVRLTVDILPAGDWNYAKVDEFLNLHIPQWERHTRG